MRRALLQVTRAHMPKRIASESTRKICQHRADPSVELHGAIAKSTRTNTAARKAAQVIVKLETRLETNRTRLRGTKASIELRGDFVH
jgi:hypothetical protein